MYSLKRERKDETVEEKRQSQEWNGVTLRLRVTSALGQNLSTA